MIFLKQENTFQSFSSKSLKDFIKNKISKPLIRIKEKIINIISKILFFYGDEAYNFA